MVMLKTNSRINPLGIDSDTPEFSWQVRTDSGAIRQTAYRIVVRSEDGELAWDTGDIVSDASVEIRWQGDALRPATRYAVELQVTDDLGAVHQSEGAWFETGLMLAGRKTLGDGAKWIGVAERALDAASAAFFDLRMEMTIPEGSTRAGIVFGASDFRLRNRNFNIWGKSEAETHFRYDVDISGLLDGSSETAMLRIHVAGMPVHGVTADWNSDAPAFSIAIPAEAVNGANAHEPMQIQLDTLANVNQVTCRINGVEVDAKRQLNPLGNTHDYNTFPNLNEIGFHVPAGGKAVYRNVEIRNPGPYSEGVLFGEKVGATYDIFRNMDGVAVRADGSILVGREAVVSCEQQDILAHADPSFGGAPMLRTEFETRRSAGPVPAPEIVSARMYVTAHGVYEMWINGERVGDAWFNPGNSEYRERIAYHAHDVKDLLRTDGRNAIAVQLAEGWWSGCQSFIMQNFNYYGDRQALMAKLVVTYSDGSVQTLVTDESNWEASLSGAVRAGSFFMGERYDARCVPVGWKLPGFRDDWLPAVEIPTKAPFSNYTLMTRLDEPARIVKTIQAQAVRPTSAHADENGRLSYLYDMGENVIGVPRLEIPAGVLEAGRRLILRYAEVLYPSNLQAYRDAGIADMMMVENYRAALSTDVYFAKDASAVVVEPHCTFHGYRYLEITGLDEPLPLEAVQTRIISSIRITAEYECSNPLVNRFFKNVSNSQTSNFLSLPTDCPQRNERLGWTGDAQVFSTAAAYNADVYAFMRQWLFTLRDDQFPNGAIPVFAPSYRQVYPDVPVRDANSFFCGVSWDAAIVLIPYHLYRQYGRTEVVRENLPAIAKYLDYLLANPMTAGDRTWDGLTSKAGILADWLGIERTDHTLINNAVFAYLLRVAARLATLVGETTLAEKYGTAHDRSKAQWNELYVDADGRTRDLEGKVQDTQASYATPLRYGMFNEGNERKAVAHFRETVRRTRTEKGNYTIRTGFSGTPNIVPTLSKYGLVEEAYTLFESTEYASWLYPVLNGATSIWERWNSYTVEGGFNGNNSMNSFNHFSLGAILEWMMGFQLGILCDEENPGFKHFLLQPQMGGRMTHAKGSFESPFGRIESGWAKAGDGAWETYSATVPFNATADLYLPMVEGETVGIAADTCSGLEILASTVHQGVPVHHLRLTAGAWTFRRIAGKVDISKA